MSEQMIITLPKLGESIVSATIIQWFKKTGDCVALDEPLLEVSTDKVNSEIPSPAAGVLKEIIAMPSQEVQVGEALAILSTEVHKKNVEPVPAFQGASPSSTENVDLLTPAVLRLLKEKGIDLSEIDRIERTGHGGRLTKKDIEAYSLSHDKDSNISFERVKMTPMRKAIAENMVRSFYQAPHASLITEIDVTGIVDLIKEQKETFLLQTGAKLTVTSFVARAIARAAGAYPFINSSLENDTIVMKHFVNLGIAVSVDQGVMVPVIRHCHQLSLSQISRQIADLADKARRHVLTPDEVSDGTITLTNFGMAGVQIGIPIIRFPEVAIVGIGAITKKVMVMPDDKAAIRSVMMVSLTFDHRVLDGLYGCGFLSDLKKHLESDLSLDG
jgi:2-oxoglutarate dehydrogenase E2 component (dihydrolipoamide succinyltransferase)